MTKKLWKVLAVSFGVGVAVCLVVLSTVILGAGWGEDGGAGPGIAERVRGAIQLVRPVFAHEGQLEGTNFLQQEAGISAFVNVGRQIDLARARDAFVGISGQGESFVIGKVALEGLPEEAFPLVYVHRDGWILAYYTKLAPASRIMPWHGYDGGRITATTLEAAIAEVCRRIGIEFLGIQGDINFYDFRFPTATTLILVADKIDEEGTDTFNYQIPFNVTLYEASWTHHAYDMMASNTKINGTAVNTWGRSKDDSYLLAWGHIEEAHLIPGVKHTVSISLDHATIREHGMLQYHLAGWAGVAVVFIYSGT